MDGEAALLARHVAMAASPCLNARGEVEAYRRSTESVEDSNSYVAPLIANGSEGLLDDLGADSPPVLLGESMPDRQRPLRGAVRREV